MRRPRTSTLVLAAVFLATLVLYLAVRPEPQADPPVRAVIVPDTTPPDTTPAEPGTSTSTTVEEGETSSTTSTTEADDGGSSSTTSTTAADEDGSSTTTTTTTEP